MDKTTERVLKHIIDTTHGRGSVSTETLESSGQFAHDELLSAVEYLRALGYISTVGRVLSGLPRNASDRAFLQGSAVKLTPQGLHYFTVKSEKRRLWWAEHWIAPLVTGFISGLAVGIIGTLLALR